MTSTFTALQRPSRLARVPASAWVAGGLCIVFALQFVLLFQKSINWDEFFHFSLIHASQRGETVPFLQVPFIYLFGWVTWLPGSNIDHIQIIRALTLVFELGLLGAIYASARKFVDHTTALLCTLAYLSAGYVFLHGASLRADVIAASLCMGAIALGLHLKMRITWYVAIGVLLALAVVSSIKSVLYLPAFLGVAYVQRDAFRQHSQHLTKAALAALVVMLAAIGAIAIAAPEIIASVQATAVSAAQYVFSGGLLPQPRYFLKQMLLGIVFTLVLATFVFWLATGKADRSHKIALMLLAAPLASVLVYRNAFPYYFTFILPPVAVAIAPTIKWLQDRCKPVLLAGALCANALILFNAEPRDKLVNQQAFLSDLSGMFPQPVSYIDESGMVGDFPRAVNHFASGWALTEYRALGEAEYKAAVLEGHVPLLVANSWALINIFAPEPIGSDRLLEQDEAFLRNNFIAHSSMVYVAGKYLEQGATLEAELIATPGPYRIEGGSITINGAVYREGATVNLRRERYTFENLGKTPAVLRWADAGKASGQTYSLYTLYSDY